MRQAAHLAVLSRHYGCLSYELAQSFQWSVQKKCGTCFLCNTVCLSPFLPSPSILEAKIEDRIYNVVVFCAGTQVDRGAEERTDGTFFVPSDDMVSATEGRNDMSGVTKEPCYRCAEGLGGKIGHTKKGSQNPDSQVN